MVGQFLWYWSAMENQLNNAIGVALELKGLQRYIVTKNIQFRDKIKILKACATVAFHDEAERKAIHKTLKDIDDYSHKRNMIAHDAFMASDDGTGVTFLRVVAAEKVDLSNTHWTWKNFEEANGRLSDFHLAASGIEQKLNSAHNLRRIVEALIAPLNQPSPNEDTGELGLLSGLFLQPQADQSSLPPPTAQVTALQTPEEPQG